MATGPSNGGTAVTITGTNFGVGAQGFICDTLPCSTNALSKPVNGGYISGTAGKTFQLTTPSHSAANSGGTTTNIVIRNLNDATQVSIPFKFTAGTSPTVATVSPAAGPTAGSTFVTITGTNFSSNSTLKIAGQTLVAGQTFLVQDANNIIALTPAVTAAGKQDIQVYNADGRSGKLTGGFNYGTNAPPAIDELSVDNGPTAGGTYVTIYGENFDENTTVSFGGTAATVSSSNPYFLGLFSPAHAAGAVDSVVTNADGQTTKTTYTFADGSGGSGGGGGGGTGGSGGGGSGGSGGGGGDGMGGGDGTGGGGSGGTGGGSGGGSNGVGGNHLDPNSGGCSMGGAGDNAASIISLLLVFGALAFAMRRQRS